MARFSDRMVREMVQMFWAAIARGEFVTAAAAEVGTYREKGTRWLIAESGIRPRRGRNLKGRCLTFAERAEIALARAGAKSMRSIARRLGRSPSTTSRGPLERRTQVSDSPAPSALLEMRLSQVCS
jgi:transposase, IS30 family